MIKLKEDKCEDCIHLDEYGICNHLEETGENCQENEGFEPKEKE